MNVRLSKVLFFFLAIMATSGIAFANAKSESPAPATSPITAPKSGIAADPLASLRPEHPRLIFTKTDWDNFAMKQKRADHEFDALLAQLKKNADKMLDAPVTVYKKTGRRLLAASREVVGRVLTLSVVYRATGDKVYLRRAEKEMLAAAAFPDWNRSHFLDVAEMATALGLGYDWLYADLSPETRKTIRDAIVEKALQGSTDRKKNSWQGSRNNWNQVCWGGLTIGALAVAEDEPALAREVLNGARANIHHGLKPYAPDGVYPEGPGYWDYGTSYQVLMNAALESAIGTDWDLAKAPGFLQSANVQRLLTGPTGVMYNFADGGERKLFAPAFYWFAKKMNHAALYMPPPKNSGDRFFALTALWWPTQGIAGNIGKDDLPLAWKGEGVNPVAVFRSSWADPNALYLACKGGSAGSSHGHMDAGSFILECDGVRWASDLGAQDYYSLESKKIGLWDNRQTGDRWRVFRMNNFSHSTITLGEKLHRVAGRAEFTAFSDGIGTGPGGKFSATINMLPIFQEGQAKSATRTFGFDAKARVVTINDDITGLKPGTEVRWAMVTKADVEVLGNEAILRKNGKTLHARLRRNQLQASAFEVIPGDPPKDDFNAPNPNTRILIVRVKATDAGNSQIAVELSPDFSLTDEAN